MAIPIIMPRQGQSVESCILVSWKVSPGDTVTAGQTVAEIETDKATFDVESPEAGTILELFFEEGADIPVLTNIAALGADGEDAAALRPGGPAEEAAPPSETAEAAEAPAAPTAAEPIAAPVASVRNGASSPRARKRAAQDGVDIQALTGTGPGGRVIERDVIAAIGTTPVSIPAPTTTSMPGEKTVIPVRGIRKIIADRMRASLANTAQLTLNRSFDATAIRAFREKVKRHGRPYGLSGVSINDLIVYAAVRTLLKHPAMNAHFLGDRIEQFPGINVGVAVDTPRGLMVPVVRDAHTMSVMDLSSAIKPLAKACLEGKITPDELSGGTFTVTNLGSLGIEDFTPVLNAPEVAILGVGGFYLKPVERPDGSVAHISAMTLSLTVDHQAVDGAPGARYLMDLAAALEDIEMLLVAG